MSDRKLPALLRELAALDARIAVARAAELDDAIARAKAIVDEYGLTAWDLGLVKVQQMPAPTRVARTFKPRTVVSVNPPMYRNPATGETWSGRGRPPLWIADADWSDFVIRSA